MYREGVCKFAINKNLKTKMFDGETKSEKSFIVILPNQIE